MFSPVALPREVILKKFSISGAAIHCEVTAFLGGLGVSHPPRIYPINTTGPIGVYPEE